MMNRWPFRQGRTKPIGGQTDKSRTNDVSARVFISSADPDLFAVFYV
jgi:hypothetical protein